MRVKLIVLAVGLALVMFALVWGSETVSTVSTMRQRTTAQTHGPDAGAPGTGVEVPKIMNGGLGDVNNNLEHLGNNVQKKMDDRPGRIDKQVEQAK